MLILKKFTSPLWAVCFILLSIIGFTSCSNSNPDSNLARINKVEEPLEFDLEAIQERGSLIALTGYNSTSYFVYKGKTMGYEYELLERLADKLEVKLEIKVVENLDSIFHYLNQGEGDVIAHNLTITQDRKSEIDFTLPINTTTQVLVQRKPKNWRNMKRHVIDRNLIRTPLDLKDTVVHVREKSSYYTRLQNLNEEIGGRIKIVTVPGSSGTEFLIKQVAHGEIPLTVADENIAKISMAYFPNIDVQTPVSLQQEVAWAVRKNAPELKKAINNWLEGMQKSSDYYVLYNKYFKNKRAIKKRVESPLFAKNSGQISPYDNLIKQHAESIQWDWRLMASLIYQESKFDPSATSWVGAKGLMQMMPETAKEMGVKNRSNPADNIAGGARYLKRLEEIWEDKIEDRSERLKFIMASYNVGAGHVLDARRLAEKHGSDPNLWEGNVAYFLRLKSKPEYYNDEVVKYGYCRGEEPFKYVEEIIDRFYHYEQFTNPNSEESTGLMTAI